MSTCPPFEEFGPTSGPAVATPDGHLRAFASTNLAGVSVNGAVVGGSFSVPPSASIVSVSVPLSPVQWFVQAAVFLGYMEAEAGLDLVVLDPAISVFRPIARQTVSFFHAIAPGAWFSSRSDATNIIPSLTIPVRLLELFGLLQGRSTTWHAGLRLWATASGFGGGGALANIFCDVPCINTVVV